METIIGISFFLLLLIWLIFPYYLLKLIRNRIRKELFVVLIYLFLGLIVIVFFAFGFGWWADKSNMILLDNYGYNYDAMNDIERYGNIAEENIERVKQLETSIMGVGWPLKAMFAIIPFAIYLPIAYLIFRIITYFRDKKKGDK